MLTNTPERLKFRVTSIMKTLLTIITVFSLALPVAAQFVEQAPLTTSDAKNSFGSRPAPTPFSLLDLSRIKWSNSYSVTYFSGGASSGTLGLFTTGMSYEFSPKLSLNVNVGIAHNPAALWGDKRNNQAKLLPGFLVDYHPSDKFRMMIGFQEFDGNSLFPYYYRRGPFSGW